MGDVFEERRKMRLIIEATTDWNNGDISALTVLMIIGNIICPQKPTAEDIALFEKRIEELVE